MNWIDKNFKDRLSNIESSYSDKVWAGVEKELFPEKRTAPSAIWLLFFAGLFTIPVLLLKDLDNRSDTTNTADSFNDNITKQFSNNDKLNQELISPKSKILQNSNPESKELIQKLAKDISLEKNQENKLNTVSNFPKNQKEATALNVESNNNSFTSNIGAVSDQTNNDIYKTQQITVKSNPLTLAPSIESKDFNSASNFNLNTTKSEIENKNLVAISQSPVAQKDLIPNKKESNLLNSDIEPSNMEVNFFNRGNILKKTKKNDLRASIFVAEIPSLSPYVLSKRIDKDPCLDHGYNINRWYSEFYLLGGTALSNINAKTTAFNEYGQKRREDETPAFSYAAGYMVGYQLEGGPFIESGFEYSQYAWNLKYIDPNSVMNTTIITIDTQFVNTQGGAVDTVFRADTTFRQDYDEISDKAKHRVIEIPLLIGMEFDLSKKLSLAIKTGVSFNLFAQSTGTIYNEELVPVKMENDGSQNPYYRSSFGMAFPINAQVYFHATNEIDVFFRGGIKLYATSITRKEYGLRENLLFTNLGTGIRIKL